MVSVEEAYQTVINNQLDFGVEYVALKDAFGRVLSEDIRADRPFPPFDRVTMDGIAINFSGYESGCKKFKIEGMQCAGEQAQTLSNNHHCIEIMTGSILPKNADTVIRYEDLVIENGFAELIAQPKSKQNIHFEGQDAPSGSVLVPKNKLLNSAHLAVAASVGLCKVPVKKLPKIALISSGDELVPVEETPLAHQIRLSNVHAVKALLSGYGVNADIFHLQDSENESAEKIKELLNNYPILVFSGGVSMGKKDFIPGALAKNGVEELFHKVSQKPGKPFWFGKKTNNLVFALPGNPVSTYLCSIKYLLPWLRACLGLKENVQKVILAENVTFKPRLNYFIQVKIENIEGKLLAKPLKHHGSGDFISLTEADGFVELPIKSEGQFFAGETVSYYPI
jgi:molybdopterin molybdotransferase